MPTLLLIEDEEKLRRSLANGLAEEGYAVTTAGEGHEGLRRAAAGKFDCIVLDWMLPGRDGLQVLRELRANGVRTPVILLTARRAVGDRVTGLDAGADDYLPKPFAFAELAARIRVCIRHGAEQPETALAAGDLRLDLIGRRVFRAGAEIEMTAREFALLEYLLRHRDQVVDRAALARDVWKDPAATMTNVIDVYVNYVRSKIELPDGPRHIHTVRGVGYEWRE